MSSQGPRYEHGDVDPMHQQQIQGMLELVRQDMKVVDATGHDIGKVEYVKMGDPDAVTTSGEGYTTPGVVYGVVAPPSGTSGSSEGAGPGAIAWPWGGFEPDVPEPIRARLVRTGFFKVDGPFLFGKDRYVRGDLIAGVVDDTVTLRVNKDELPEKGQDYAA